MAKNKLTKLYHKSAQSGHFGRKENLNETKTYWATVSGKTRTRC